MRATVNTYAIALLVALATVESFFAPNMQVGELMTELLRIIQICNKRSFPLSQIGEVSMANVFKQFRESKISASVLIESGSKPALLKSSSAAEEKIAIMDPAIDTALMVFIVESKTCGATTCINTVRVIVLQSYIN